MKSKKQICLFSSSPFIFLTCFLVTLLRITSLSASNVGNETDYLALLSFKSMVHDPFGTLNSWNTSIHFCDWSGISCGKRHRRVTVVQMKSQGLTGFLSPHLGNLSFLRELRLRENGFQGTIPHELGRLSRLRILDLQSNNFSGEIPTNISRCSNLEKFSLASNKLVGGIPKDISNLSKLTFVALDYNNLTGGIPPFLGNITSMKVFSVRKNPFGGSIPNAIGNWKSLKVLYIAGCKLHGTIPHSIYNLSLVTNLNLAENQLTGSIPSDMDAMLPNLVLLLLSDNHLTGVLPPSISNCTKLKFLDISQNKFSGKLTTNFGKLRDVIVIVLGLNLFGSGDEDEMKFFDSMQNCSRLEKLEISNCKFQGVLPISIGNLSNKLSYIHMGENRLRGNLPSSIGNLVSLTALSIGYNQLTGTIPSTIGRLEKLELASLNENQFSGPIPDAIGNLSLLNNLYLDSNRLEGHIPSSLGKCRYLLELYLSKNKLSGIIPKEILQLSSLSIALDLSENHLYGSLPIQIGNLKTLTSLDFSNNNLSGNIPSSLGGCASLSFLNFHGNLFQGIIPQSLSSLRGLAGLDLSNNNFSGQIPRFLERLSLQYLNLSFNNLEGEVPMLGVFANATAFSAIGNSKLCGEMIQLGIPKCNVTEKHTKRFPVFIIGILIASTILVILSIVYACWKRKKNKAQASLTSMHERFLKVSYNELFKATAGFSEANFIGQGGFSSVYKGILENDDRVVAIKVINLQNRGAHASFIRECEAWRCIRHRNLLKILTACSSIDFQGNDFKALVYEYMPNGSLHDWMHSSESTSRLDLLQRINIFINVASAVDYLHNHGTETIIHGDLKPSNILLDDDMVAHVGDFGLARFLGSFSNQNSSTGIRGTVGYTAPEYGVESVMTSSGDVYSVGILLLEVMTRKKPTDMVFNEGLSLHRYAYVALPR